MGGKGKVVAVIPAYNEEDRIQDTISNLRKIEIIDEIVVVDDGSDDSTEFRAKELGVKVIKLERNYGKGYAIKKAAEEVAYDYLVLVDGDLGRTSAEVERLILPVLSDQADVTVARFGKPKKKGGLGFVKGLAKKGVYFYTKENFNSTLSGQRVYKKEVIEKIKYIPDRFGVEIAMTIEAFNNNFRILEVDVEMTHRETGRDLQGFIHRGKQFLDVAKTLLVLPFKR